MSEVPLQIEGGKLAWWDPDVDMCMLNLSTSSAAGSRRGENKG